MRVTMALLLAGIAVAQQRPPETAPKDTSKDLASVEGRLSNIAGEPLKKGILTLRATTSGSADNPKAYGAISDGEGKFVITDIAPGSYQLVVERVGYLRQAYGGKPSAFQGTTLTLAAGQHLSDLSFKLTPQSTISGKTLDEDGDPIRASVFVMKSMYVRGKRQVRPMSGVTSDDQGDYKISGLAPGRYYLGVTYRQRLFSSGDVQVARPKPGEPEMGYVTTYFAGSTDPSSATPLEVLVGQDATGINIRLKKAEIYRVNGSITGTVPDVPVTRIRVSLMPRDTSRVFMFDAGTSVTKEGSFELTGIRPGSYELVAMRAEGMTQILARLPLEIGKQNIDGVTLTLQPPSDMHGSVRIENSQPGSTARSSTVGTRISLSPSDNGTMYNYPSASVKDDGTFVLPNVANGKYQVTVFSMPDGLYLKSARFGDQEVSNGEVEFGGRGNLELVLKAGAGQITGSVQNEKQLPAIGSTVTLIPDPPQPDRTDLYKVATTDQGGAFTMKNISPGQYRAYAWSDLEPGAHFDSEFMKPHESRGEKVTLEDNGAVQLQLKMIVVGTQ